MSTRVDDLKLDQELELSVADFLRTGRGASSQLIDVREQDEWDEGRIASARLIPLAELGDRLAELDRAKPIVVVCRSGRRSLIAASFLRDHGFAQPLSLAGGIIAWASAGQAIER